MKLIEGKVAIVTGAARGIGKAIALKFAAEGANIAFTDLVIDENGLATQKEIEALGVKAKGYASNAANFEETHNVVAEIVKDFGRVDILVNNAGITKDGLMMRMSEGQWDAVIGVNLKSAFIVIGGLGIIWMGLWMFLYKKPNVNPRVNAAELEYIEQDKYSPCLGKFETLQE